MALLAILNLLCTITLPLQISSAFKYLFYFYGGYVLYKHSQRFLRVISSSNIFWMWLLFVVVFAVLRPLKDSFVIGNVDIPLFRLLTMISRRLCQLIYASIGSVVFYCTMVNYVKNHKLKPTTLKVASCCFGIYLFQQFILQLMYYRTSIPGILGPYWLPWFGFIVTLLLSLWLSSLLLKTGIGKKLIG